VQPIGHENQAGGREQAAADRQQRQVGPEVMTGDDATAASDLGAEPRDHLGQPLRRIAVARAILGVAVQRQVGQHDAKATGQGRHDRLPLAMRETERVQQHERRAGSGLAIGHSGAVRVVIEPQSHAWIVAARAGDRRDPIAPPVPGEVPAHEGGPEGSSWIHRRTGHWPGRQDIECDHKTNSEAAEFHRLATFIDGRSVDRRH
jgi:hypothetical protein